MVIVSARGERIALREPPVDCCEAGAARYVRRIDGTVVRCRLSRGHDATHSFLIEDGSTAVQWREDR